MKFKGDFVQKEKWKIQKKTISSPSHRTLAVLSHPFSPHTASPVPQHRYGGPRTRPLGGGWAPARVAQTLGVRVHTRAPIYAFLNMTPRYMSRE